MKIIRDENQVSIKLSIKEFKNLHYNIRSLIRDGQFAEGHKGFIIELSAKICSFMTEYFI